MERFESTEILQKINIENKEELLQELDYMKCLCTGRIDVEFCNAFIEESVQLLINSILLFEKGYFDCAFYSIRQSSENINNMLLLSNDTKSLDNWKQKGYFPPNNKVLEKVKDIDAGFEDIKEHLSCFFEEYDKLIKTAHKIIHKQGFDTFYAVRQYLKLENKFDLSKEINLFDKLVRYSIIKIYLIYIILDPIGYILADEDLNRKLNFDPIADPINLNFIKENYDEDLPALLRETNFYRDLVDFLSAKEEMNDYTYAVKRYYFFDCENLDKIYSQKHLLTVFEQFILDILSEGIQLSRIYINSSIMCYDTTIKSNYNRHKWSLREFDNMQEKNIFNKEYNGVYISVIMLYESKVIIEHNDILTKKEMDNVNKILKKYQTEL